MKRTLIAAALAALVPPSAALAARPLPETAVLAIDRKAAFRNFVPTRMLPGFAYDSWSYRGGVLRIDFRNRAGRTIVWRVAPMSGACDAGKQKSFQLAGNKVWWAQSAGSQRAWRCVFGQDGKPLRLSASSTTPRTQLADVGLGRIAASAHRY